MPDSGAEHQDAGPAAPHSRARRTGPGAALALVAYAVLTMVNVHPLGLHLATHVNDPGRDRFWHLIEADAYLCIWILAWDAHALVTQPLRLFQANDFYPAPDALAMQENLLGLTPFAAPVWWATGNAVLAAQVTMLATYVIGGLGVFLLVRRWAGWGPAFVAGLAYAFAGWRIPTLASLQHLAVHWWPFALLALEAAVATGSARAFAGVTGALVASGLTCVYWGYGAFLLVGVHALCRLRLLARHPRRALGIAAASGAAAVLLVPVMLPYLRLRAHGVVHPFDPRTQFFPVNLLPWALPAFLPPTLAAAAIVVGGIARLRAGSRAPGATPGSAWALVLGLVATGLILGLGAYLHWTGTGVLIPLPYLLLTRVLPGFSSARIPTRFLVIASLGVAVALGLALAELGRRARGRLGRAILVALTVAVGAQLVWRPAVAVKPIAATADVPPVYRYLRQHGEGRPVLELPVHGLHAPYHHARALYFSTFHWLPLLNGHGGHPPPTFEFVMKSARALPARGALEQLVSLVDVGWVLVHREALTPEALARWTPPPRGLEPVGRFEDVDLYQVTLPPKRNWRARFARWYDATETLRGTPLRPLPRGAKIGRLTSRSFGTLVIDEGRKVRLRVKARNWTGSIWPAHAVLPRHLVVVRARWLDGAGRRVGTWTADFRLPRDVAPGASAQVVVEAPGVEPGTIEPQLEIALAQDAEDFPAELSPPLRVPVRFAPAREESGS